MRTISIGAFGALWWSARLAHGQASQSTTATDVNREVVSATSVILRVPDLDKTKPTFTAKTTTVTTRETILDGDVVVQIEDTRVTADRAVVSRDGEIRFEGNVRVERPARVGANLNPAGTRASRFRYSVGREF